MFTKVCEIAANFVSTLIIDCQHREGKSRQGSQMQQKCSKIKLATVAALKNVDIRQKYCRI
jgi:hypothetical protein